MPRWCEDGTRRASDSFCEPAAWAGPFGEPLPEPRGPVRVQAFGAGDLAEVRKLVAVRARAAGLTASRARRPRAGGQRGGLEQHPPRRRRGHAPHLERGDTLLCEVQDRGRLRDPLAGRRRPDFTELGGQGLWITNQVCDLVQLRSFADGSAVRIHMRTRLTRATVRTRARAESEDQRLNRNLDQLLQELRVVLPGVQVLFAFLLAVPFSVALRRCRRLRARRLLRRAAALSARRSRCSWRRRSSIASSSGASRSATSSISEAP